MTKRPLTVRLPFWLADRSFSIERLLAAQPRPWSESRPLVEAFALSEPEKRFIRALLRRKRNLWVFRCNQTAFCGDFVVIDMSPAIGLRSAAVLELKTNAGLKVNDQGRHVQTQNALAAIDEIVQETGILPPQTTVRYAWGGEEELLGWLRATSKSRGSLGAVS